MTGKGVADREYNNGPYARQESAGWHSGCPSQDAPRCQWRCLWPLEKTADRPPGLERIVRHNHPSRLRRRPTEYDNVAATPDIAPNSDDATSEIGRASCRQRV